MSHVQIIEDPRDPRAILRHYKGRWSLFEDGDRAVMRFIEAGRDRSQGTGSFSVWSYVKNLEKGAPMSGGDTMQSCGARTRRGTSCAMRNVFANGRCIWHGGKSTGPRTPEGRKRVSEAQKKRWARWRAENPKILPEVSDRHERRMRQRYNTMLAMDLIKGQQKAWDRETFLQELVEAKFPPKSMEAQVRDAYLTQVARQKHEAKGKVDRARLQHEARQWLEDRRSRAALPDQGTGGCGTSAWIEALLAEIDTAGSSPVSLPPTTQPQHVAQTLEHREPAAIPEHHLRRLNRDARRRAENERGRELMANAAELRGRPTRYRR
jgi:hypothetical protein